MRGSVAAWGIVLLGGSLGLGLTASCGGSAETTPGEAGGSSATGSSTGDAIPPPMCAPTLAELDSDWCSRIVAGSPGQNAIPLDLSAAHAQARFFGVQGSYIEADQALVAALGPGTISLDAYAQGLAGTVCTLAASTNALDAGFLSPDTPEKGILTIVPGTGKAPLGLLEAATGIVVDLRKIPGDTSIEIAAAIENAIGPALGTDALRAIERVREHDGMVDEVFSATNVYSNKIVTKNQSVIPAKSPKDLPLVLLTAGRMSPEAAQVAGALRLANRAWIYGDDLRTEVAESRWVGIGKRGIFYRYRDLLVGNRRWPDVIPADVRGRPAECAFTPGAFPKGPPPPLDLGPDDRPKIKPMKPFGAKQPAPVTTGSATAALYVAHGAVNLFFPDYASFPAPAPDFDGHFLTVLAPLAKAVSVDRPTALEALRTLGAVLNDGHQFVFDYATPHAGQFLVMIEDVDNKPVVRRSATPGIGAGDTITYIGGVAADQWYQAELARTSAGTDGYRFNVATRRYLLLDGPTDFSLVDADGKPKTVTVQPATQAEATAFGFAPSLRKAGWLDDLGAPALYYINLSEDVLTDITDFRTSLAAAANASGLVLDMRGYPGVDHYEVAQRIIGYPFNSPGFHTPVLTGPDVRTVKDDNYKESPLDSPSYGGKVVLLVGHETVSAAENFSTMLVDAKRVTVVGRQSAGTNGNITGVQIPGDFAFSFTGMKVTHADGSPFLGLGIVPDVDVTLTAKAFRDGIDPELMAAIQVLSP